YIAEKAGTARHRPATNAPFIFNIKTVGGMILLKVKFTDCFVEIAKLVQQCKHNHFKDAALQAESESVLRSHSAPSHPAVPLSIPRCPFPPLAAPFHRSPPQIDAQGRQGVGGSQCGAVRQTKSVGGQLQRRHPCHPNKWAGAHRGE
ncbi:unnamed protein product, partial [Closterium sp. Naga37s-1]